MRNALAVNGPLTVAKDGGRRVVNDSKRKIWMQMTEQTLTFLSHCFRHSSRTVFFPSLVSAAIAQTKNIEIDKVEAILFHN